MTIILDNFNAKVGNESVDEVIGHNKEDHLVLFYFEAKYSVNIYFD